MRHDAKRKEAADELQVKEKNQLTSCQNHPEAGWAQELVKAVTSTIAGVMTLATNTRPVAFGAVAETRPSP